MGWSLGYDRNWKRDVGYGVPAICDDPECTEEIDRGLSYVCGGEPYGGDCGCGLYFCGNHLWYGKEAQLCRQCGDGKEPFKPKPDTREWMEWKLTHESWAARSRAARLASCSASRSAVRSLSAAMTASTCSRLSSAAWATPSAASAARRCASMFCARTASSRPGSIGSGGLGESHDMMRLQIMGAPDPAGQRCHLAMP